MRSRDQTINCHRYTNIRKLQCQQFLCQRLGTLHHNMSVRVYALKWYIVIYLIINVDNVILKEYLTIFVCSMLRN